jgi:site-specific recombinase XerD
MARERGGFDNTHRVMVPWNPMPYMDEFLNNLRIEERSDDYVRMVRVGLSYFATFAATENVVHPDDIKRAHILRFQAFLQKQTKQDGEPFKIAYRQKLMTYVRAWINWLEAVGYIEDNPWVRIKVGATPKKPRPLEQDEVLALFDTHRQGAFSIAPFSFHRREVILVLLFAWGLRIHELQSLTVAAMDMRQDYVTVRNKGGGSKALPYGPELKQVVNRWLRHRATHAVHSDDSLLIDMNGGQLSLGRIRAIVTETGDRAGIQINPHRLRDTFGTTMLDNDVEVERIMKMMGHTNRAQTLAYARVGDKKVMESHNRVMGPLLSQLLTGRR